MDHQAKLNHGQEWIDQNIHTFVAVGAPFLGAPKSVRGLVRAIVIYTLIRNQCIHYYIF
jgi:hypothetical protein